MKNMKIDEAGHIVVKNLSAFWIPEIKIEREIHGTVYTITGSYEGTELPERKLTRILLKMWRMPNDKREEYCYNGTSQSCADSCPRKGGNRNVKGN